MKLFTTLALLVGFGVSTAAYPQELEPIKIKKGDFLYAKEGYTMRVETSKEYYAMEFCYDFNQNGKVDHFASFPIKDIEESLSIIKTASTVYKFRKEYEPEKIPNNFEINNIKRVWFDIDGNGSLETKMNRRNLKRFMEGKVTKRVMKKVLQNYRNK